MIGQQQTNLSNMSSGVQIPRDICTRFGRYLSGSTNCSWIIIVNKMKNINSKTSVLKKFKNWSPVSGGMSKWEFPWVLGTTWHSIAFQTGWGESYIVYESLCCFQCVNVLRWHCKNLDTEVFVCRGRETFHMKKYSNPGYFGGSRIRGPFCPVQPATDCY